MSAHVLLILLNELGKRDKMPTEKGGAENAKTKNPNNCDTKILATF